MKKGIVLKITSAIVCFILLLSIGGVIATWTYSNSFIDDVAQIKVKNHNIITIDVKSWIKT